MTISVTLVPPLPKVESPIYPFLRRIRGREGLHPFGMSELHRYGRIDSCRDRKCL
jgi:hypothetical protein